MGIPRALTTLLPLLAACLPRTAEERLELPATLSGDFLVSDWFSPSGMSGDGVDPGLVRVHVNESCLDGSGGEGDCYRVDYTMGAEGWAGGCWLYPPENWGDEPGRLVSVDFARVSYKVALEGAVEQAVFSAGGAGQDADLPYQDEILVADAFLPGTEPEAHALDLQGSMWTRVVAAFCWALRPVPDAGDVRLYLDALRWEAL